MRLGALDVYRDRAGGLSTRSLSRALTFAEVAMQGILDAEHAGPRSAGCHSWTTPTATALEVYQAQGMVLVQLGVSAEEALVRDSGRTPSRTIDGSSTLLVT